MKMIMLKNNSRNQQRSYQHQEHWQSMDLFSFSPSYHFTKYTSYLGCLCSLVSFVVIFFYIILSSVDFIKQPPELVKIGSTALSEIPNQNVFVTPPIALEISYFIQDKESGNLTKSFVDAANTDPYFRYKFSAQTITQQDDLPRSSVDIPGVECWHSLMKNILCPADDLRRKQTIQGTFHLSKYQYFKIEILRCTDDMDGNCATPEEIDEMIQNGDVAVIAYVKEEAFDPSMYHYHEKGGYDSQSKRGVYENIQTWRFFPLPGQHQLTEIFMEARSIQYENPLFGSMKKSRKIEIMSLNRIDTKHKSNNVRRNGASNVMKFYFRLHNRISDEKIQYRTRSILDLVSFWGAMASFVTIFSLGAFARWYNQKKFKSNLAQKRRQVEKSFFKNPHHFDAHLFDDIRLFHQEDFDERGQLRLSKEELYFPTSLFGELRRIALIEHRRRKNAAMKISEWYLSELCKQQRKTFIEAKATSDIDDLSQSSSQKPLINENQDQDTLTRLNSLKSRSSPSVSFPVSMESTVNEFSFSTSSNRESESPPSLVSSTEALYTMLPQSTQDVKSIQEMLLEKSIALVKKARHNRQSRPWTELSETLSSHDIVFALFNSFLPVSSTKRITTWKLNGDEVNQFLGLKEGEYIHPVNFEGKVVCAPGQKPSVYAWAKYEICQANYIKKSRLLKLRFQTSLSGTGIPDEEGNPQYEY